ncbi:MAG: GTPase Era [Clostridia bacterium]|jgi:GTP-binding protein Era|nr:GTPase Era [Clostridia bacterium]
MTKTAFVSIVGCPNVGKSSLLNRFLGQKVAIVTRKPQTTRTRIIGVLTKGETQFVFTDTPGYHRPKNKLGEKMIKAVGEGISGMDACLFVTEPEGEIRTAETELLARLRKEGAPVILALNKTDSVTNKEAMMKKVMQFTAAYDFEAVVPCSALTGDNVDAILDELGKLAYESPHFFPDDTLTDQPERVIASEMIREKILLLLDREVPHGTAVAIEKMRERETGGIMDVEAVIYCEKESHKGIIIGKKGETLKKISTKARMDMERFFGCKVNLQCWVKVKEGWRNREGLIHNFGLD